MKLKSLYINSLFIRIIISIIVGVVILYSSFVNNGYTLRFKVSSSNMGMVTVSQNGQPILKSGMFTSDSLFRTHNVFINAQTNNLSVDCESFIQDKNFTCSLMDVNLYSPSGKLIKKIATTPLVNKKNMVLFTNLRLQKLSFFETIQLFAKYLSGFLIAYFILWSIFKKNKYYAPVIITYMISFIYFVYSSPDIFTGVDSIENVNVAMNLFTKHPYYSYVEYRGIFWFFILWVISKISLILKEDFYYTYLVFGSVLFSILNAFLIPRIYHYIKRQELSRIRIFIICLFNLILFGKQFACPLPDILPVLLLTATWFLYFRLKNIFIKCIIISLFIALNGLIKINFILLVIPFGLSIIYLAGNKYSYVYKSIFLACLIVPMIGLITINTMYNNSLPIPISNGTLANTLMYRGLTIQKSEPFDIADNGGIEMLKLENIQSANNMDVKKYINLILKYPVNFIARVTTRLFNGLDIRASQVYFHYNSPNIPSIFDRLFQFLNYTCIYFGILLYSKSVTIKNNRLVFNLLLLSFFLPVSIYLVSWVEPRYFDPIAILVTTLGAININYIYGTRNKIYYVLFIICCFTFASSIYNQSNSYALF